MGNVIEGYFGYSIKKLKFYRCKTYIMRDSEDPKTIHLCKNKTFKGHFTVDVDEFWQTEYRHINKVAIFYDMLLKINNL